jgi:3-hydroxyacyl-CoA dehydrogenase
MTIKKAAVIGAGVMGAGIAAQLANAGLDVELLDRVDPKNGDDRSAIAKGAIDKLLKTTPAPLMHKSYAKRIRPGNTEDDIARLKEVDLVIEAVFEDPKVKSDIFKKIDANRRADTIVASNTSTIPLHDLIADQSDELKKYFVITHFFNPPRYMPLLELVTSQYNDKMLIAEITRFMDEKMGKGVIPCNDTPGFIGNRIGTFWIQSAINEAYSRNMTVEEADAVMGKPIGAPKTGVFGLVDLVGLDLMPHISKSLTSLLPPSDAYCKNDMTYPVIDKMIADGYTGRKGKGGFYRLNAQREKLAVDLKTGAERPAQKIKLPKKSLHDLAESKDKFGNYAWAVLKKTLSYAADHAHEITDNITGVDDAMKLGYNWKFGPFELIDKIGVDYFISRLKSEQEEVPPFLLKAAGRTFYRTENGKLQYLDKNGAYQNVTRPEGVLLLADIKRAAKPVFSNAKNLPVLGPVGAKIWDIKDGVLCVEFCSKMNSIDYWSLKAIEKACDIIGDGKGAYKALVIHNEGDDFSVGANIGVALIAAKIKMLFLIDKMVTLGHQTYKRLKYAPFPVVSAPSGKALGGGCEVLLHSHYVQAHAETYPGLVEVGVGLLPAWGGSTELLTRALQSKKLAQGPMPAVVNVFETISTAKVGLSAYEAKDLFYLRETDGVTMNKSRLLADAKAKALEMTKNHTVEKPFELSLPGPGGHAALNNAVDGFYKNGKATTYDVVVSDHVATVLTGGDKAGPGFKVTQDYVRGLEHKNFMALLHDKRTVARIESIIKSGKPLREKPDGSKATDLRAAVPPVTVNDNTDGVIVDNKPKFTWPNLKQPK